MLNHRYVLLLAPLLLIGCSSHEKQHARNNKKQQQIKADRSDYKQNKLVENYKETSAQLNSTYQTELAIISSRSTNQTNDLLVHANAKMNEQHSSWWGWYPPNNALKYYPLQRYSYWLEIDVNKLPYFIKRFAKHGLDTTEVNQLKADLEKVHTLITHSNEYKEEFQQRMNRKRGRKE